jgi:hypothetical protein
VVPELHPPLPLYRGLKQISLVVAACKGWLPREECILPGRGVGEARLMVS